jgi:hypothetical protein
MLRAPNHPDVSCKRVKALPFVNVSGWYGRNKKRM